MRFLIDEDVDVRVGSLLVDTHEASYARDVFGVQTKDDENVAWAHAQQAILVTGDRDVAKKLRGSRACGCLHLLDLKTREFDRIRELLAVRPLEFEHYGRRIRPFHPGDGGPYGGPDGRDPSPLEDSRLTAKWYEKWYGCRIERPSA